MSARYRIELTDPHAADATDPESRRAVHMLADMIAAFGWVVDAVEFWTDDE